MEEVKLVFRGIYENRDESSALKGEEALTFKGNRWNDFGYLTYFDVTYQKDSIPIEIGGVRFCKEDVKQEELFDDVDVVSEVVKHYKEEQKFDGRFCSLASSMIFYEELYKVLGNDPAKFKELLEKIREITSIQDNEEIKKFEKLDVFSLSLTRMGYGADTELVKLTKAKNELGEKENTFLLLLNCKKNFELLNKKDKEEAMKEDFFESYCQIARSNQKVFERLYDYIFHHSDEIRKRKENEKWLNLLSENFEDRIDFSTKVREISNTIIKTIIEKIEEIKKALEITDLSKVGLNGKDVRFGHYTSMSTVNYLIKKSKKNQKENQEENPKEEFPQLRLTNLRQLNDPMEGRVLLDFLLEENKDERFVQSHIYISSATTNLDSLPMWKQYADDGKGVVLIYDRGYLKEILRTGKIKLYKVAYLDMKKEDENSEISKLLKELKQIIEKNVKGKKISKDDIIPLLNQISFLFKRKDYSYEEEYRFAMDCENDLGEITAENKEGYPLPFLYTYLKGYKLLYETVILGPKAMDIDYIAPYLKYCYDDKEIEIKESEISFR